MNNKIMTKILATMLAFTLTFANVVLLGIYTEETYAASTNLEDQSTAVSKSSIEFDAYFLEEGEITHSKNIDIGTNNENLCLSIKVASGYLSNASIKIEDANFKLDLEDKKSEFIEGIDEESKKLTLNKIDSGESVVLEVPIKMNTDSNFDVKNFSERTKVILEGTYVTTNGKERKVSKEIEVYTGIKAEAEAELSQKVEKYVQFDVNGEKGVILQTSIKSKLKDNILPVKQTELEIESPKINGVEPSKIVVSANSTRATNGGNTKIFTSDEYTNEDGKIKLLIENKIKEDGKVAWERNAEDELIITYIYDENAITKKADIALNVNSKIQAYDSEGKEVTQSLSEAVTLDEEIGEILNFDLSLNEQDIQKGYMEVAGAQNTPYVETMIANIGYSKFVDSIILEEKTSYVDAKGHEYPSAPLYTYTKIESENFIEMFGEDGYINILNKDGEIISTLNKDKLEYRYENETTYIRLETSKPQTEGIVKVESGREIKPLEYDKLQMKMFSQMRITSNGKATYQNTDLFKSKVSTDVALVEPKTSIEASINKTNLSTVEDNTGVEIKVVLDTNDITKSLYKNPKLTLEFPSYIQDLSEGKIGILYGQGLTLGKSTKYKNKEGKVVIEVPMSGEQTEFNTSAVSNGATVIIYGTLKIDELTPAIEDSIKAYITNEEQDSCETEIKIKYGAQNKVLTKNAIIGYDNEENEVEALEGTEVAQILPNAKKKKAEVALDVVNSTDKKINNIKILGRIPSEGNTTILSGESLNSTFTADMISAIKEDLGDNAKDVTVYYSTNEKASKNNMSDWTQDLKDLKDAKSYLIDLNDTELSVGERISFRYGVQIPEKIGEDKETYSTFAVYYNEIEEDGNGERTENNITKIEESGKVGLKTIQEEKKGEVYQVIDNDNLKASISLSTSGRQMAKDETVKEGQYIDYTVTITNKTNKEQTYDLEVSKENGTFYGLYVESLSTDPDEHPLHKYGELNDETIKSELKVKGHETKTYNFTLVVNKETAEKPLNANVTIKGNGLDDYTLTSTNTIKKGTLKLCLSFNTSEEWETHTGKFFPIHFDIENISGEELTNTSVSVQIPDFFTYKNSSAWTNGGLDALKDGNMTFKQEENTLIFTFQTLEIGEADTVLISLWVEDFEDLVSSRDVSLIATANVQGEPYLSNVYKRTISQNKTELTAEISGSIQNDYVENGDELSYIIDISNVGTLDEPNLCVTDELPKGLRTKSYTIINENGEETVTNTQYTSISIDGLELKAGKSMKIKITADVVELATESDILTNSATLKGNLFKKITTNEVTYKLKRTDTSDVQTSPTPTPDPTPETTTEPTGSPTTTPSNEPTTQPTQSQPTPSVPSSQNTPTEAPIKEKTNLKLSGIVWLDEDSDGERTSGEKTLQGIKVYLMNNKTSEYLKDKNGKLLTAVTDSNGKYEFTELSEGEYIAVFEYDTQLYSPTIYKVEGVKENVNSDATSGEVMLNGKETNVAVTDIINLTQSNASNIDLGLTQSQKFDLKLDKIVNTVIIQNKQGTKTNTFKNNKLAKIEIPSKYMKGSDITVEYKITVTNEGDVAGKVGKIVDYIPKDMTFSSEINNEWYKDSDGNIYTTELENTIIKPGESKDVTLVLTMVLQDASPEIINNTAEIVEYYNTQGIQDIDSTPGNKAQNEDDLSSADMIIAVKTGVLTYVGIGLGLLVIALVLAGGIYMIKRKVLVTKI